MTIVLKYTTEDGSQEQVEFEDDIIRISLRSKRISSIDLKPLVSCTNLQLLSLGFNQLQTIDLSPLGSCSNLRHLELRGNLLQNINLSPLASCPNLFDLDLTNNRLHSIDLYPLASCDSLRSLRLGGNYPHSFDLSPLALCKDINFTTLSSNSSYSWLKVLLFEDEEGTPLKFDYKRPERSYPWSFLYRVLKEFGEDHRVQQDIIRALGFGYFGFVERDIRELLLSFPQETPLEVVQEQLKIKLIEEIVKVVDKGGTTTGLNLKRTTQIGEIAKITQKIVEIRASEMKQVQVEVFEDLPPCTCESSELIPSLVKGKRVCANCGSVPSIVDLHELWLTAYGYEVLTALGIRFSTDLKGLEQIKNALAELGFQLKSGDTSVSGVKMSDELKQTIWWIAENRGKTWNEIDIAEK
ncbi:leucine-rich repeat domain-containing protein [Candidatus Thorarchaeota archaeon]|nr:MAG: leucine-rich repeat domain-containing protein [Candidatus Thorarchaeota archaeon]